MMSPCLDSTGRLEQVLYWGVEPGELQQILIYGILMGQLNKIVFIVKYFLASHILDSDNFNYWYIVDI